MKKKLVTLVLENCIVITHIGICLQLLVLVVALTACVADEEPQASAGPSPILVHNDHVDSVEAHRLKQGLARLRSDLKSIVGHRQRDDRHRDDGHHGDRHRNDRRHDDRHRDERYRDNRHRDHHDDGRWWEQRVDHFDQEEPEGPVILRSIRPNVSGLSFTYNHNPVL